MSDKPLPAPEKVRKCAFPKELWYVHCVIFRGIKYINTAYIPGPYADAYGETANHEAMPGRCATAAL